MTDFSLPSRRLPAEWEEHDCVMLAWPHELTDWNYMLDDARRCIASIVRAISGRECVLLVGPADLCLESVTAEGFDPKRVRFLDIPTNDTWARDFGPITVETPSGMRPVDFKFNGWGLKFASNHDNLINRRVASAGIFRNSLDNRLNFVLEGGSIESDGCGTILTTSECLLSPNRNGQWGRKEITAYLQTVLGADRVLWLDHGALAGDDTDSHIDTLARLAPHDTIIYVGPGEESDPDHSSLVAMREQIASLTTAGGNPYNLIELPLPDPVYDEDGFQLPATYANFLVSTDAVYLPVYGQPKKDLLASQMLKIVYPDHEIVSIDCRALIRQHGSLHCVTMQLPKGTVKDIENGYWK
ncbi:MAG: agmatine deiminase family protein [Duncaniella sp.]|nr:agmatine deiminase family protein [Duncaniella sp.]